METLDGNNLPYAWDKRQPSELDALKPNGFRFMIKRLPKVTYFCQAANLPAINLGAASQTTPLIDIPRPGEKLWFNDLTIKFLVQEDMANYMELYKWLIALGFPSSHKQYASVFRKNPEQNKSDIGEYSDAALLILGSDQNPVAQVNFYDCFPTMLEGLEFNSTLSNVEYFTGVAVFKYRVYDIEILTNNT
jgi:hypothetical protein